MGIPHRGWLVLGNVSRKLPNPCVSIKETRRKQLINMAHFSHNNITKPKMIHTENIMAAIAEYAKAIKGMRSENGADEMKQL